MIELTITQALWLAGATLALVLTTALSFYGIGRRAERRIWHEFAEIADGELARRRAAAETLNRAAGWKP